MYEVDQLANLVAMASEQEQLALTEDIKANGQRESAVLWQGRIVDGRCRQLACVTLGIELDVRELDSNLSREEVAVIVKSLNTRRNLTDMQKCMSAYKQQVQKQLSNDEVSKQWGIALGTYKNAKYIAVNRPELVEDLFNGKSVSLVDPDKGYVVTTNKINTLARIVKKINEIGITVDTSEQVTISFNVDGVLKTEKAKEWYYANVKDKGITDTQILAWLVELANYKFR